MRNKKKTSFLKIILNTLVIVLFIALVAAGAGIGFLYFKYQVNIFNTINQIKQLNQNVDLDTLVTNGYTQSDYDSINTKIQNAEDGTVNQLNFTDRELCAYLNNHLDKIANFNIGDSTLDLNSCGFEMLQITLSDIPINQPNEHYCNLSVVLKLNIADLKNKKMGSFPINVLKDRIPNVLYFSANCSIDEVDGTYVVTPNGLTINNLSADNTASFFTTINKFISFTTAENLNRNISSALTDALLSASGVYGKLEDNGATGYGWQNPNEFIVYFVDIDQTYTITYSDPHGVENTNVTNYTIRNNIITLQNLSDNGYNFDGWFMDVDGTETKVTTIDAATMQNYSLYCKWSIIQYTVTCDLRGGEIAGNSTYSITYTIEDASFTLPDNATKKISDDLTLAFAGWLGEDLEDVTKIVTITHGSYGNKNYAAYYDGEELNLELVVDGVTVNTASVEAGSVLSLGDINNLLANRLSGYTISAWYLDSELSNAYNYSAALKTNKTLYATTTYINNCVYFYPYLAEFSNAVENTSVLTINSRKKLIAYIDYCIFYDVRTEIPLLLSYITNDGTAITNEIIAAYDERNTLNSFSRYYVYSRGYQTKLGTCYGIYRLTDSDNTSIAQNHFTGEDIPVYAQQDYALRADDLEIRANSYNNFKINYIGKSLSVSTSEQLVWALENGYNPICTAGSSAETVYNKAKQVLRDICSDNMNDIEKLHAIYQWLALHVSYDQEALEKYERGIIGSDEARTYDSWYAEGVFNYGKAICEGYAKSLLIMAKLEGIPTVRVSGNGHMWNKVYVNGAWYGIDATHGDLGFNNSQEIFTNTEFLFTDNYKTAQNYTATNYTEFVANTTINGYDNIKFTYNGISYDLFINNQAELSALIHYVNGYGTAISCNYYTLEVAVASSNRIMFNSWFNNTTSEWSIITFSGPQKTDSCGNIIYMLRHNANV